MRSPPAGNDGEVLALCHFARRRRAHQNASSCKFFGDRRSGKHIGRLGEGVAIGNATMQEYKVSLLQQPKRVLLNYHYDVLASASDRVEKK
jgi:hypothetical protein